MGTVIEDQSRQPTRGSAYQEPDWLRDLAWHGASSSDIGGALITFTDAAPGRDHEYIRWYEDDHYIAGAMAWPWLFAGRRWSADDRLRQLREPECGALFAPLDRGTYLHTYLISGGHVADLEAYAQHSVDRLRQEGRLGDTSARSHVYTYYYDYLGAAYAAATPVRDIHALDHPYSSVVLQVVDADDPLSKQDLADWLRERFAPRVFEGREATVAPSLCVVFSPRPPVSGTPNPLLAEQVSYDPARLTLLWLSAGAPEDAFSAVVRHADAISEEGAGRVRLVAPFTPAVTGTS